MAALAATGTTTCGDSQQMRARLSALARHVPRSVVQELLLGPKQTPRQRKTTAAVLFLDISGFTKLAQNLTVDILSFHINEYFSQLLSVISKHGGEIAKFAGDAIFAVWQIEKESIEHNIYSAAICGAEVVSVLNDYVIDGVNKASEQLSIGVHCGCGAGQMFFQNVGTSARAEFLICGDALDQAVHAESVSTCGELVVSLNIWESLNKMGLTTGDQSDRSVELPYVDEELSVCTVARENQSCIIFPGHQQTISVQELVDVDTLLAAIPEDYIGSLAEQLEPYVHTVIRSNAQLFLKRVVSAEIRSVMVFFLKLEVPQNEDLRNGTDAMLNFLQDAAKLVLDEVGIYRGHLRQFIQDDKGIVFIGTFGLAGSVVDDIVKRNVLPCTISIETKIQSSLGSSCRIGVTVGNCYCGTVGGESRHEYSVMGPSVNLAARLMCSPANPGILCDKMIWDRAGKSDLFVMKELPSIQAKGYDDLVRIFSVAANEKRLPHNRKIKKYAVLPHPRCTGRVWHLSRHLNRSIENTQYNIVRQQSSFQSDGKRRPLVGRNAELSAITESAYHQITSARDKPLGIAIVGSGGTGKTLLMENAIDSILKYSSDLGHKVNIFGGTAVFGYKDLPFAAFAGILSSILDNIADINEFTDGEKAPTAESAAEARINTVRWLTESNEGIGEFAPLLFTMSGFSALASHSSAKELLEKMPNPGKNAERRQRVIEVAFALLMHPKAATKAFYLQSSINVFLLDDTQWMDYESWSLLHLLWARMPLDLGNKYLIMFAKRPIDQGHEPEHWKSMNDDNNGELLVIKLNKLSPTATAVLLATEIAGGIGMPTKVIPREVDEGLNIFERSGGNPLFVLEIAKALVTYHLVQISKDGERICLVETDVKPIEKELSSRSSQHRRTVSNFDGITHLILNSASIEELLIGKLDLLEHHEKELLYLAATLGGRGFTLDDMQRLKPGNAWTFTLEKLCAVEWLHKEREHGHGITEISENWHYRFPNQTSEALVLSALLPEVRREYYRRVAEAFHADPLSADKDTSSFLMQQWIGAREYQIAAKYGIRCCKLYSSCGFSKMAISVCHRMLRHLDTEGFLNKTSMNESREPSLGQYIDAALQFYVLLGKSTADLGQTKESAQAYQRAYKLVADADADADCSLIQDRSSKVFPIYSGLLLALKWEQIKDDDNRSKERTIVEHFVVETKRDGNPVHICRSLAMLGVLLGQTAMWKDALISHAELQSLYLSDSEEVSKTISERIVASYGSDRAAQNFPLSVQWYFLVQQCDKAEAQIRICHDLIEKSDKKNNHNSFMLVFPFICILVDPNAQERKHSIALQLFREHVTDAWKEFNQGGTTFFLCVHAHVLRWLMLLYCAETMDDGTITALTHELDTAAGNHKAEPSSRVVHASHVMSMLGRSLASIFAESYFCAGAQKTLSKKERTCLLKKGKMWHSLALEAVNKDIRSQKSQIWEARACEALGKALEKELSMLIDK